MRPFKKLKQRRKSRAFKLLLAPIFERFKSDNQLESRGYRPLQMTFDDQLKALVFSHLEEYSSGSELLQALEQNDFAKECVAPPKGIKKSSFFEAINNRGLEQLTDYRSGSKKAKAHVGFDINRGIPRKIYLTDGKEGERPFVSKILDTGETGVFHNLLIFCLGVGQVGAYAGSIFIADCHKVCTLATF